MIAFIEGLISEKRELNVIFDFLVSSDKQFIEREVLSKNNILWWLLGVKFIDLGMD